MAQNERKIIVYFAHTKILLYSNITNHRRYNVATYISIETKLKHIWRYRTHVNNVYVSSCTFERAK